MDEDFLMVLAPAHAREIIRDWPLSHYILCLHIDGAQEMHAVDAHDFEYMIGEIDPGIPALPKLRGRPFASLNFSRLLSCLEAVASNRDGLLQQVRDDCVSLRQEDLTSWLLDSGYRSHDTGDLRVFRKASSKITLCLGPCEGHCLRRAIEECCRAEGVSREVFHRMVERHRADKLVLDDGF